MDNKKHELSVDRYWIKEENMIDLGLTLRACRNEAGCLSLDEIAEIIKAELGEDVNYLKEKL
ncbi:MAG: hypothetical protein PHS93_09040 [Candidatus Omnitrophica bacterium]|nr:hypothetical protein [Candidatus Omnitrophota bacterium]MDD5551281.1 hypothetical protein [Candidatus Omnitrophota bacterium]